MQLSPPCHHLWSGTRQGLLPQPTLKLDLLYETKECKFCQTAQDFHRERNHSISLTTAQAVCPQALSSFHRKQATPKRTQVSLCRGWRDQNWGLPRLVEAVGLSTPGKWAMPCRTSRTLHRVPLGTVSKQMLSCTYDSLVNPHPPIKKKKKNQPTNNNNQKKPKKTKKTQLTGKLCAELKFNTESARKKKILG